jgi:hypothetical protein
VHEAGRPADILQTQAPSTLPIRSPRPANPQVSELHAFRAAERVARQESSIISRAACISAEVSAEWVSVAPVGLTSGAAGVRNRVEAGMLARRTEGMYARQY